MVGGESMVGWWGGNVQRVDEGAEVLGCSQCACHA